MRPSTTWVIARRELSMRVRSKAFRVSSAVLLLSLVLGIVVPVWAMRRDDRYTVAVVSTRADDLSLALIAHGAAVGLTVTPRVAADRAEAVALVDAGSADTAVVTSSHPPEVIWAGEVTAELTPVLTAALSRAVAAERADALGLTPAQRAELFAPAEPVMTRLHPRPDRAPQMIIAMVGMILLFVALNFYGGYVLTGVVEEKSSRVVEVLLARVRPAELLAGKVLGIGLLGIGQFAGLAVAAAVTLQIVQPPHLPAGTLPLIAGVVLWFVLGYSFYSVLYGALGALASRTEDAQAVVAPLTTFLMLAYFGAFTMMSNATGWWITAASLFPPTAPIYLPLRSALTDVPGWQTALSMALMVAAIGVLLRVGGRLYRGGVLHTGGRLRIGQAWRGAS
jgi:ABC-2 type transport system permease protein